MYLAIWCLRRWHWEMYFSIIAAMTLYVNLFPFSLWFQDWFNNSRVKFRKTQKVLKNEHLSTTQDNLSMKHLMETILWSWSKLEMGSSGVPSNLVTHAGYNNLMFSLVLTVTWRIFNILFCVSFSFTEKKVFWLKLLQKANYIRSKDWNT